MKLKNLMLITSLFIFSLVSCNGQKTKEKSAKGGKKITLNTEIDTVSYSLGVSVAQNLKRQGLKSVNTEVIAKAIEDVYNEKDLLIDLEKANQILQNYFQNLIKKKAEENLIAGQKYLEENKTKKGVVTLPSGLQYTVLNEGDGPQPKLEDKVTTHYHGTLIDGTVFDSSVERGQPATFPVSGVIKGWTEALQLMKVGAKWKLFIPSDIAYGENPRPGGPIEPNSALIFEIELISIEK